MDNSELLNDNVDINMAFGYPGSEPINKDKIAEILHRSIKESGESSLQYTPASGLSFVKDTVKKFLSEKGVKINSDDELILPPGGTSALFYTFFATLNHKEYVIVESPTFIGTLNTLRFLKSNIDQVKLDEDGLNIDLLEAKIKEINKNGGKVKLIYTIPTAHNPTGVIMNDDRRKELIEVANKYDL
ncbi:MAG: aminotransferase class I/II-fold pyridoxal phosphate-dependent enzyme, partial [Caldisphaera sp.]